MKPFLRITTALVLLISLFGASALADEVEDFCAGEWEVDSSLYTECVNEQNTAKAKLANYTGDVAVICEEKWGDNYLERLGCAEVQEDAKAYIDGATGGPEISKCRTEGAGDYEVIAYCIDENWSELLDSVLDEAEGSELASPPPISSGFYILKAVKDLRGPFIVTAVNEDGTLALDGQVIALSGVELTMPRKAVTFLSNRLVGREVFLEADKRQPKLSYLYASSPSGDWGDWAGNTRLEQVNVTLVEAGFASPVANPTEDRYTHFYQSAARRAENAQLGMWAGR